MANPERPIPRLSRRLQMHSGRRNDGVDYYNLHVIPTDLAPVQHPYFSPLIPQPNIPDIQQPSSSSNRTITYKKQKRNKSRLYARSLRTNLIEVPSSVPSTENIKSIASNINVNILEADTFDASPDIVESKSPYKSNHHIDGRSSSSKVLTKSRSPSVSRNYMDSKSSRSSARLESPRYPKITTTEERESDLYYDKYYGSSRSHRRSDNYDDRGDWDGRDLHYTEKCSYEWYNRRYRPDRRSRQEHESWEEISDAALEDGDFEEVEVASDEEHKESEVPVGFRKCKVKYLGQKKGTSFFKPKIFYICPERTVINCLNLQEEEWKAQEDEIDVVSEEDYEMETEVVIEEQTEDDNEISSEPNLKTDIKTRHAVVTSDSASDVLKTDLGNKSSEVEAFISNSRSYRRCIPDHPDFYQGEIIIQSDIDAWNSHLIGLSYIIEIRDKLDDTNVLQHRCILCAADIHAENDSGEMVINHVISYKHMFNYLVILIKGAQF